MPSRIRAPRVSLIENQDVSAASLYMTAKISFLPQSTRSVLNVYAYLLSPTSPLRQPPEPGTTGKEKPDAESYCLSEGSYHPARAALLQTESILLRSISFITQVILPHHLALTYLQTSHPHSHVECPGSPHARTPQHSVVLSAAAVPDTSTAGSGRGGNISCGEGSGGQATEHGVVGGL